MELQHGKNGVKQEKKSIVKNKHLNGKIWYHMLNSTNFVII